jgi:RNA polymerase sigma-70 factor, ECF subfamily
VIETVGAATDSDAFVALLREYDGRLRALAARLLVGLPDLVDDVLQDAYVSAFRALPRFRGDADMGTWLYRITYNACVDELRRARRRPAPMDVHGHERPSGDDFEARVSTNDLALRALATLSMDQRAAVVLVDGEGVGFDTAAETLGVPRGTVASRVSRARAHIRRAIGKDET